MAFNDIINQKKAKEVILGQLASGRVPHAYLFIGPDGVGRRKTALELAKTLNCSNNASAHSDYAAPCDHCISCQKIASGLHPDVQTIDFAYQARLEKKDIEKQKAIKIDTIRALGHDVNLKPCEGRWKIYIIEPAEKITLDAANCLLKTLEEPPAWTVIILIARNKENLPLTIVSRTQVLFFSPLAESDVARYLETKASVPHAKAAEIAKGAEGSLSWALSRAGEKNIPLENLWQGLSAGGAKITELLAMSQQYAKNAPEFTTELLGLAKHEFRANPAGMEPAIEAILDAQNLLSQNVNAQMVLDNLFIKLNDRR